MILLLGSDYKGLGNARITKEFDSLNKVFEERKITFEKRLNVKRDDVSVLLTENEPEVVHFMGHGTAKSGPLFDGDEHQEFLDLSDDLIDKIQRHHDDHEPVQLYVFNCCESAEIIEKLKDRIPSAVFIGTSKRVDDDPACKFSERLYLQLVSGSSVSNAFKDAQEAALSYYREKYPESYSTYRDQHKDDYIIRNEARRKIDWNKSRWKSIEDKFWDSVNIGVIPYDGKDIHDNSELGYSVSLPSNQEIGIFITFSLYGIKHDESLFKIGDGDGALFSGESEWRGGQVINGHVPFNPSSFKDCSRVFAIDVVMMLRGKTDGLERDRRSHIWIYDPLTKTWFPETSTDSMQQIFKSRITDKGGMVPREVRQIGDHLVNLRNNRWCSQRLRNLAKLIQQNKSNKADNEASKILEKMIDARLTEYHQLEKALKELPFHDVNFKYFNFSGKQTITIDITAAVTQINGHLSHAQSLLRKDIQEWHAVPTDALLAIPDGSDGDRIKTWLSRLNEDEGDQRTVVDPRDAGTILFPDHSPSNREENPLLERNVISKLAESSISLTQSYIRSMRWRLEDHRADFIEFEKEYQITESISSRSLNQLEALDALLLLMDGYYLEARCKDNRHYDLRKAVERSGFPAVRRMLKVDINF